MVLIVQRRPLLIGEPRGPLTNACVQAQRKPLLSAHAQALRGAEHTVLRLSCNPNATLNATPDVCISGLYLAAVESLQLRQQLTDTLKQNIHRDFAWGGDTCHHREHPLVFGSVVRRHGCWLCSNDSGPKHRTHKQPRQFCASEM
jgi:hypothetical protein